jgi:hypothetical protein
MTPKEVVKRTVKFENPDRLVKSFPEKFGSDFGGVGMTPSPDARQSGKGEFVDEWGAVWENIGICNLGEVKEFPLKDWNDFNKLRIPDINDPKRWDTLEEQKQNQGDLFVMAYGISLYERVHFIRGLENTWTDIYTDTEKLEKLISILVEMNLEAIKHYSKVKPDAYMWCDDWGLQDRLMISPEKWRDIWKPAYAEVYKAAHEAGMLTFLHSCGHIVDILDDLIEAGLDVIQMDQQVNMGLDLLSERFKGRIAFWCPVDIQAIMCNHTLDEIRAYCHEIFEKLGSKEGGFLPKWYGDPVGAGHSEEAVNAMCEEFLKLSQEIYGKS